MATTFYGTCDTCQWRGGPYKSQRMANYAHSRHSCDLHTRRRAMHQRSLARDAAIDRTPKPCTHPRASHQHGTYAAYSLDRCRCLPCTVACSDYTTDLRRRKAYGRTGSVPAEPVRAHIAHLRAGGMGLKGVSVAAGVSSGVLTKIVYGTPREDGTRRPPCEVVRERTAERILAVTLDMVLDGARVHALGTRRRVQALMACGWSRPLIAEVAGVDRQVIERIDTKGSVYARTARAIADAYDTLWSLEPPQRTKWELGAAVRTKNTARKRGYAPPLAWDDIDNPTEAPDLGARERGLDLDEWLHLVMGGNSPEQAAKRCGTSTTYVQSLARERNRPDVLRAIAEHLLKHESHGTAVKHAESLLAEVKDGCHGVRHERAET